MYKKNSRKVEMPKYSARTDIEYSLRKNVPEERSMAIRTDLKYFSAFKYSAYLIIRIWTVFISNDGLDWTIGVIMAW